MALKTTWNDSNKIVTKDRCVKYSSTPEYWTGGDITVRLPIYWRLSRVSTMEFSYLGMDRATAVSCAKSLRDEYTRKYANWTTTVVEKTNEAPTVLINEDYVFECQSSFEPVLVSGDNWRVDCSISETDVIVSLDELLTVSEFESYFQIAEQRESTASGSIAISSAKWMSNVESGVIQCDYNAIIVNFDYTKVSVEVKGQNDVWTTAQLLPASSQKKGHVEFYSTTNATFRLRYDNGTIVSKEWTTKNRVTPSITAVSATYHMEWTPWPPASNFVPFDEYTTAKAIVSISDMSAGNAMNASGFMFYIWDANRRYEQRVSSITPLGNGTYLFEMVGVRRSSLSGTVNVAVNWKSEDITSNSVVATKTDFLDLGAVTCTDKTESGSNYIFSMSANFTSDYSTADLENVMSVFCDTADEQITCTNVSYSYDQGSGILVFQVQLPKSWGTYVCTFYTKTTTNKISNFVTSSWTPPKSLAIASAVLSGGVLSVGLTTDYTDAELNEDLTLYYRTAIWRSMTPVPVTNVSNKAFTLDFHQQYDYMDIYLIPSSGRMTNQVSVTIQ